MMLVHEVNGDIENQCRHDPETCPAESLTDTDDMSLAIEHTEVEGKENKHQKQKPDPNPNGHEKSFRKCKLLTGISRLFYQIFDEIQEVSRARIIPEFRFRLHAGNEA
jgi:hypothetical protein